MAATTASGRVTRSRVVRFTENTNWTVPPGVYYVEVEASGGGGGRTINSLGAGGSDTTVSFGASTVVGPAVPVAPTGRARTDPIRIGSWSNTNTGRGSLGSYGMSFSSSDRGPTGQTDLFAGDAGKVTEGFTGGLAVNPGGALSVIIGSGGSATTSGDSGFAVIRYEV